jgi:phage tail sheath gpL-like
VRASELVARLMAEIALHGDLPVVVCDEFEELRQATHHEGDVSYLDDLRVYHWHDDADPEGFVYIGGPLLERRHKSELARGDGG